MVTNMTYAERVENARRKQLYEPLRPRLQRLINEGYTRWEITSMMFIGRSSLEIAIAALGLHIGDEKHGDHGSYQHTGRSAHNMDAYEQSVNQAHAAERAADLALIKCVRQEYGPIGRGFSTA